MRVLVYTCKNFSKFVKKVEVFGFLEVDKYRYYYNFFEEKLFAHKVKRSSIAARIDCFMKQGICS